MALPARYLAATLLVLLAAALRAALPALELPFLLFIPMLMVIGFFLGRGPAIYATALAALLAAYLFIPPTFSLTLPGKDWFATGSFALVNLGIVAVCAALGESLIRREADLAALAESRALAAHSEATLRQLNETLEQRVAQEVADRSRTEEALRQSQKMEAVGQLTGGLAHDLNNMLAGITGSLELLKTRLGQGRLQELDRYIDGAEGAASRAAALTHRLLAFWFSRISRAGGGGSRHSAWDADEAPRPMCEACHAQAYPAPHPAGVAGSADPAGTRRPRYRGRIPGPNGRLSGLRLPVRCGAQPL